MKHEEITTSVKDSLTSIFMDIWLWYYFTQWTRPTGNQSSHCFDQPVELREAKRFILDDNIFLTNSTHRTVDWP